MCGDRNLEIVTDLYPVGEMVLVKVSAYRTGSRTFAKRSYMVIWRRLLFVTDTFCQYDQLAN